MSPPGKKNNKYFECFERLEAHEDLMNMKNKTWVTWVGGGRNYLETLTREHCGCGQKWQTQTEMT